jgi:DNA-binding response OmpR family regulator
MIAFIDERETVRAVYESWFAREGASTIGLSPSDFQIWIETISEADAEALEAVIIGQASNIEGLPAKIRRKGWAAIIAIVEGKSLEETLTAFRGGVDDVVRKPVHAKELMARIDAILQRKVAERSAANPCKVFAGGGDPMIAGVPLSLPRRERRILEYLVRNEGRRVSKTQLFNTVYGMFDSRVDESIVESHVSKLRKKLRNAIGYDPIDSKRFLGYLLQFRPSVSPAVSGEPNHGASRRLAGRSHDLGRVEVALASD